MGIRLLYIRVAKKSLNQYVGLIGWTGILGLHDRASAQCHQSIRDMGTLSMKFTHWESHTLNSLCKTMELKTAWSINANQTACQCWCAGLTSLAVSHRCNQYILILLVLELERNRKTRSILWMMMPWILALPNHQQRCLEVCYGRLCFHCNELLGFAFPICM